MGGASVGTAPDDGPLHKHAAQGVPTEPEPPEDYYVAPPPWTEPEEEVLAPKQ
jgi:hypothetical protein